MALPALPKELGNPGRDIHSIFLYLQRIRDSFTGVVSETVIVSSYTDENAQDAVAGIMQDSTTVNVTYDDATPKITWDVLSDSTTQRIEVKKDSSLIGTKKTLNFLQKAHNQLTVVDDPMQGEVEISIEPYSSRLVAQGEVATLRDTQSLVVSRYFRIDGTFALEGDATLEIL